MKEKIIQVFKISRNSAYSENELFYKVKPNINIGEFNKQLKEMEIEGLLYCVNSKKRIYILNPFREGIFHVRRNNTCYVETLDGDFNINSKTYGALDKDRVLIRITDYNNNIASLKDIVERHGLVAELITKKNRRYAVVDNKKYEIVVSSDIVDGTLVGIKIEKSKSNKPKYATLDRIIGHKNSPRLDEKKILYENDMPDEWNEKVLEELKTIPNEVLENEIINRCNHDLRDEIIFTIDGDDTKDIDDAISIQKFDDNFVLKVHIADVSYYVKENSELDIAAMDRGTSVYMPGVVSPMYPTKLSNGICSLNPNVDRLAITCEMKIDFNGSLLDFEIYKSVINSKIQMTYKNVNKILTKNVIPSGYDKYVDKLKDMYELSKILVKSRVKRGMLDFDSSELKLETDQNGKLISITNRKSGVGEKLIEVFMLAANECVATYIFNMQLPMLYRVHEFPNEEKLHLVTSVIKSYGQIINTRVTSKDNKVIQSLLSELKDSLNFDIFSNMILRSMAKATYETSNIGHYGIGIDSKKKEAYTHFTSPIRRYPDTMVHRILSYILAGDIEKISTNEFKSKLSIISDHSSKREVIADKCEKEANKMKMAEYMANRIGEIHVGRIVGFTKHGMFIKMDNLIEGRVDFGSMDDYFVYDENIEIIIGERTKKIYRLGDSLTVKVVRASKELREIDLVIDKKNGNTK